MEWITQLLPPAFPALAVAHFLALLSPGPDFFLLVGYAIRYRLRGSIGLCLGIAAGNGLYILLVVVGSDLLRQMPLLFSAVGSHLLRSRARETPSHSVRSTSPSLGKQLLLGLGSSLLNPKNALFYLALMTALLGPHVTFIQQAACGIWMTAVVLLWDLLLVMLIALPQVQHRLKHLIWRIERLAGGILLAFGGWVLWHAFVG